MSLLLARVDDRLIHGQVVVGCCGPLRAQRLLLCNDAVAGDEVAQSIYGAAVPPEVAAEFHSLEDAPQRLAELEESGEGRYTILVVETPADMLRLIESGAAIGEVNLGGLHHREERTLEPWPGMYVSEPERAQLRRLLELGVRLRVQGRPGVGGRRWRLSSRRRSVSMTPAVLLGALAGGDRTAFGQTLLAHPAIAAALAGWAAGAPAEGVWLGVALTGLSTAQIPVGETRLRDWTSAAVAAPFLAVGGDTWRWGAALLLSFGVAWIGGRAIGLVREVSRRRVAAAKDLAEEGNLEGLERLHGMLTVLHFVRGGVVVAAAVGLGRILLDAWAPSPPEARLLESTWAVAPLAGVPILLRFQLGLASPRWLAAGVVAGAAVGWALGVGP